MAKSWKTRLIHSDVHVPEGYRSLASPVFRGSTTLFPDAASVDDSWDQYDVGYTYGLYGTPTTLELAGKICELEKGYRTIITPGGQGAISLINFAVLKSGDHILLPENVYTPNRHLARSVLRRFGVEVGFYPPEVGGGIKDLLRENTRLVWCESPGSITMEVEDVPAIAEAAHARGVLVALDNTWAAGVYFDAFAHGVDISMQALTKYVGGHSDLLMGSVTVKDPKLYRQLGATQQLLGSASSPDDCSLALRGMRTMGVRLKHIEASALQIARWLAARREIERVLHPALEGSPGHQLWKRDFTGSAGVFSIVFKPEATKAEVLALVDGLELFEIGYSWGGVTSLAVAYDFHGAKGRPDYGHRIVRLNIGLEDTEDLIEDLKRCLAKVWRR
ncbi:MAG TPA: cystathionine beta-lyase [Candidatus Sulfotelmatobacter sp.]|jgi:cystathionine beta-lyase|nr:cystathionine beta-lyase [Candidatus Sulfotelmatobacter sp.]